MRLRKKNKTWEAEACRAKTAAPGSRTDRGGGWGERLWGPWAARRHRPCWGSCQGCSRLLSHPRSCKSPLTHVPVISAPGETRFGLT